jgi:ABC-type phosphate transport system substrate-binding protein
MTLLSARRIVPACILSAAAVTAFVAPGAANAATIGQQCSGSNITGKGSSLQKLAQQSVWDPAFNTSGNPKACNGTQGSKGIPTVTYESVGSGAGMEAWGVNGHAFEGSNGFVGTDEPPNQIQKEEIQSHSKHPKTNTLETIPVLQGAVAIIVRLPAQCEGTSKAFPGRLVLDNVTLEKIWNGSITKWSEITDNGDALKTFVGDPVKCKPETPITRVVRKDQSGTTSILKKYLALINGEKNVFGELGWREIADGLPNVEDWPGTVTRPEGTGGGELVKKVAATPGSIGYANLADARSNGSFAGPTGGPGTKDFWTPIQNNGTAQEEETYADPATNGDAKALGNANCANTEYTNGESPSPPSSTFEVWNEVTTKTSEAKYTLCGLTYDLTFHEYSQYPSTTLEEATTVNNFALWLTTTGTGGGQLLIKQHDYFELPSSLLSIARTGAETTKF